MYLHNPIEFRLIKYTAPELGALIPQVERKKAAPSVHKAVPELSTPEERADIVMPVPGSREPPDEYYRRDHDQLTQLELHHAYQQVRNFWDRQQFHPERHPLHIGVGQDGSQTARAALQSAEYLGRPYHARISQLPAWRNEQGRLQMPDTPHAVSLLVLPRRERSELASVIAQAPCPILVQCGDRPLRQLKKILVPVDGTAVSYRALAKGLLCCEDFGSELRVMHVGTIEQQPIEHQQLSQRLAQLAWHEIKHDVVTVVGDVIEQILAYAAAANIDLIIMGTHRDQEKRGGSLTLDLIERSPFPVWVV